MECVSCGNTKIYNSFLMVIDAISAGNLIGAINPRGTLSNGFQRDISKASTSQDII